MNAQLRNAAAALAIAASCLAAQAQTVLKFAHADQTNSGRHAGVTLFAKKVEEYSQGRVKVQVYCCGQLGSDPKVIEQLVLGGIDLTLSSTGSYAPYLPTLNLTMLPFAFENYEQGWKFYDDSPWLKQQFAKAPEKGFRFLAPWEGGFRNMTTRDPLNTPADAKGKKLRSFANEMMRWSLEAMGFGVQIMPLPEVYMAIQQGVVAGQENPIDMINGQKFYEVAPYVTVTNHVYSPTPVVISEKTWQRLSPADRQAVAKAAADVTPFMRTWIKDGDEKLLAEMASKGAKV
ncbi:MAG: TRAP transporter substrate-binding protein, partial [Pseudomonadota bacterium]